MFTLSRILVCLFVLGSGLTLTASAQNGGKGVYTQLTSVTLAKGARLNAHTFKVDRAAITLTGTIYFSAPVDGKHTTAVFLGDGKFSAHVPESSFEKANVRRLLKTDVVESDFSAAV